MLMKCLLKQVLTIVALISLLNIFTSALHPAQAPPPGDLTFYKAAAKAALKLVADGDLTGATKKMVEAEKKWDSSGYLEDIYPDLDHQLDVALTALRSGDAKKATNELKHYFDIANNTPNPYAK
jgi:hypothetical protein